MESVATRPPDLRALAAARQHARNMTWEACAAKTLAVYRELLGASHG